MPPRCSFERPLLLTAPKIVIDGNEPFSIGTALKIPHSPGVYLIRDWRGTLYVGRSDNLHRRFEQHLWLEANPLLQQAIAEPFGDLWFSWHQTTPKRAIALEAILIAQLRPPCNRIGFKKEVNPWHM